MTNLHEKSLWIAAGAALFEGAVVTGQSSATPWYKRACRWCKIGAPGESEQDIAWWRDYWKRLALQGVVIDASNAIDQSGKGATIFRQLTDAAHQDGLAVLASVDAGRVNEVVFQAHPDVVARDAASQPIPVDDGYAVCGNNWFRDPYMAGILAGIVNRYRVEGIAESGWSGLGRETICHCQDCAKRFRDTAGKDLPRAAAWTDPAYQDWIRWSYARRLTIWDSGNKATQAAGGPNCLWIGLIAAARSLQARNFTDVREIAKKTPFLLIDNQSRFDGGGFRNNAADGRYLNGLANQNTVVELMAMYPQGHGPFVRSSSPAAEARLWMISGFAGEFQPCVAFPSAHSEDRRVYQVAPPLMQWHQKNERYLTNRTAMATIGLVWSPSSADVYGLDAATSLSELPFRGMVNALDRSHIPFNTIHIADMEREARHLKVIVLPNVAAMSDEECGVVRRFVEAGGSLVASGVTSLYDGAGQERTDFGLASVFGAHLPGDAPSRLFFVDAAAQEFEVPNAGGRGGGAPPAAADAGRGATGRGAGGRGPAGGASGFGRGGGAGRGGAGSNIVPGPGTLYVANSSSGFAMVNNYLRLLPELAAKTNGPHNPVEVPAVGTRHAILAGLEQTDIIPFGGRLTNLRVEDNRSVLMTYVPPFPGMPIDNMWTNVPRTNIPGLVVGNYGKGKVVFLAADVDRRYGMDPTIDHEHVLRNIFRWAAGDNVTVSVDGRATVGSHCYQQQNRVILHLLNETGTDNQKSLLSESYPVGPFKVKVKLPAGVKGQTVRLLVGEATVPHRMADGLEFEVARLVDHEVIVIE